MRRPSPPLLALLVLLASSLPTATAAAPLPLVAPAPTALQARVGPFAFQIGAYQLHRLPIDRLPYNGASIVGSCGLTDPSGVAMYRAGDGTIYDHPVAQTRCALNMQRNYRISPDPEYLEIAIANANRLLDRAVSRQGGIFFPYGFSWNNPGRSLMRPPWYSGMAQGQALSAFVRLFEWTGDAKWLTAAHQTFASFKVARVTGAPWVVGVEQGQLWLDEYPTQPLDKVFNGHNFGAYGLYDYWRVTDNADARLLLLGALHSTYTGGASRIRLPGGISHYCSSDKCLANRVRNPAYHITHIGQLTKLFHITGHWHFASQAEAFIGDSPRTTGGRASLSAGVHDGYEFDASGIGTRVSRVTLASATTATYSRRDVPGGRTRPGNGIWLHISAGSLNGLWVRESSRARPLGFVDTHDFMWNRAVRLAAGSYTGRTYNADGVVTGSAPTSTAGTTWSYTNYARINGAPSVLLSTGPLAGTWLALDTRTTRDSTSLTDIDSSAFRNDIIWLTTREITRGCATYRYCPAAGVTREQMASFLVRSLELPPAKRDHFTDDEGRAAEDDINRLADSGITVGCAARRFCPTGGVTRAQMASFIARALDLAAPSRDYFDDDATSTHQGDINRLAESGITGGCGTRRFCPTASVTRGQMAAFLHRAFANRTATAGLADERSASPNASQSPAASPSVPPSPTAEPTGSPSPSTAPSVPTGTAPPASPTAEPSPSPTGTAPPDASPAPSLGSPDPTPSP